MLQPPSLKGFKKESSLLTQPEQVTQLTNHHNPCKDPQVITSFPTLLRAGSALKWEQDMEGFGQLGHMKEPLLQAASQHPPVLTGSNSFPHDTLGPHLFQFTMPWQLMSSTGKQHFWVAPFNGKNTTSNKIISWAPQAQCCCCCVLLKHEPNPEHCFPTRSWTHKSQFLSTKNRCWPSWIIPGLLQEKAVTSSSAAPAADKWHITACCNALPLSALTYCFLDTFIT